MSSERTVSPTFNAADHDIILLSKDNVEFRVHRKNLAAASTFFESMMADASSDAGVTQLEVDDGSEDLETALQYCYPRPAKPLNIKFPESWSLINVLDKYEIWRGIEAVEQNLMRVSPLHVKPTGTRLPATASKTACHLTNETLLLCVSHFCFASHFDQQELLRRSIDLILLGGFEPATLENIFATVRTDIRRQWSESQSQSLMKFYEARRTSILYRRQDLLTAMLSDLQEEKHSCPSLVPTLRIWNRTFLCSSLSSLEAYVSASEVEQMNCVICQDVLQDSLYGLESHIDKMPQFSNVEE